MPLLDRRSPSARCRRALGLLGWLASALLPSTASARQPAVDPAGAAATAVAVPASAGRNDGVRDALLAALAVRRLELGLPALRRVPALDRAADAQAREMTAGGWWGYTSPAGVSIEARVERAGFAADLVAAKLYSAPLAEQPQALAARWWSSPAPARQSLFHGGADSVGLGIAENAAERIFVFVLAHQAPDVSTSPPPSLGGDRRSRRADFLVAANAARRGHGLPPLSADPILDRVAQEHAEAMLAALRAGRPGSTVESLNWRLADRFTTPDVLTPGTPGGSVSYRDQSDMHIHTNLGAGQAVVIDALSAGEAVRLAVGNEPADLLGSFVRLGVGVAYEGGGGPPHAIWVACLTRRR